MAKYLTPPHLPTWPELLGSIHLLQTHKIYQITPATFSFSKSTPQISANSSVNIHGGDGKEESLEGGNKEQEDEE